MLIRTQEHNTSMNMYHHSDLNQALTVGASFSSYSNVKGSFPYLPCECVDAEAQSSSCACSALSSGELRSEPTIREGSEVEWFFYRKT